MSLLYPASACNGGEDVVYQCNPCPIYEYGRIRSVAYVKRNYIDTLINNPTETLLWLNGTDSGDVIPIWETQGSYDGGSTTELTGFGDRATFNGNTTHVLTYKDPNYSDNCEFYNNKRNQTDYCFVYRTSSKVHFIDVPVTITPKNPVQDDINQVQSWEVQIKWTSPDSPCPVDMPQDVFDVCYTND